MFLFSVKHTVIKEETIASDFGSQKLDLTQRDPVDLSQDDCIEEPTEQLCLTEDCVKAGKTIHQYTCLVSPRKTLTILEKLWECHYHGRETKSVLPILCVYVIRKCACSN